jgi:hypothetical protein
MSGLSPQCATKRTSVNAMNLLVHALVQLEVRRPGPCRLLAQPSLDGGAALNIRIKPNNISREQPGQQAQVSLKGGRDGWGSPGLHKRVSVCIALVARLGAKSSVETNRRIRVSARDFDLMD